MLGPICWEEPQEGKNAKKWDLGGGRGVKKGQKGSKAPKTSFFSTFDPLLLSYPLPIPILLAFLPSLCSLQQIGPKILKIGQKICVPQIFL